MSDSHDSNCPARQAAILGTDTLVSHLEKAGIPEHILEGAAEELLDILDNFAHYILHVANEAQQAPTDTLLN